MTSDDAKPRPGSWRIVWRALRVGHVDDPQYEALTRETAGRNVRNGWLLILFSVTLAIQVILVVFRLARGADLSNTAVIAVSASFMAFGLGVSWMARRRSRRYLERTSAHHQPEGG